jgi:hypothetical protein
MGGQRHSPAFYPRERDTVRIIQGVVLSPGPVWTGAINLASAGIRGPDRPAASRYTDYAIPAQLIQYTLRYLGISRQAVRKIMREQNILR